MGRRLFDPGKVMATPGALELLTETGTNLAELLDRHLSGDWGEVPREDARENERSLKYGFRIVSSYPAGSEAAGERVWIITEADRSSTCLLLPSEYRTSRRRIQGRERRRDV